MVIVLRKESIVTSLLDQYNSLIQSKSYAYREMQLLPLIKEAFLYSRWRLSQETTAGNNAEINGLWEPSPNRYIYDTAPSSTAQGRTLEKTERLKEPECQEVCCETVSPRNGCKNQDENNDNISVEYWNVEIRTAMLMWNGKNFMGLHHQKKNYRHLLTSRRRQIASPMEEPHYWLLSAEWSALNHIYTDNTLDSAGCIYTYVCIQ